MSEEKASLHAHGSFRKKKKEKKTVLL